MSTRGQTGAWLLVVPIVLVIGPGHAHATWPDVTGEGVRGDFDNDGAMETVASSPELNSGKGLVWVVEPSAGAVVGWTRDSSGVLGTGVANDFFGAAVAVGDFNGDNYDDLAIGAPGADDSGFSNSGAVHVLYGSSSGLTASGDQLWHQESTGITGEAEVDEDFGSVLATSDFNCDGNDDLVISVPLESVGSADDAGAVHVLYGSSGGLSNVDDFYRQGFNGVNGAAETGDHFGAAVVGGNFNGDQVSSTDCDDLAVGSPDDSVGSVADAGVIYVAYGGSSGLTTTGDFATSQDVSGVEDVAETSDRFGARLLAGDSNDDGYADLGVITPGDSCVPGHGAARHLFFGSSSGITVTGDDIECDLSRCLIDEAESVYGCHSYSPPVYGSTTAETINMFVGDDFVYAGGGNDVVLGDHGSDVLFGAAGNDTFDAGPGLDIQIGGAGNDVFIVDLDCEVQDGEVIDGGPGSNTVQSHLTRAEMVAMGVELSSVNFVTVAEGTGNCDLVAYEEGTFARPPVALSWDDLPNQDSVFTSAGSTLDLHVQNVGDVAVVAELLFTLVVQGQTAEAGATVTLDASQSTTYVLDLEDFIPIGVDPENVDPALLDIPTSAVMSTRAELTVGGAHAGYAFAPKLYGHLEDDGATLVVYRIDAYHTTYRSGDLVGWRSGRGIYSGPGSLMGRIDASVEAPP